MKSRQYRVAQDIEIYKTRGFWHAQFADESYGSMLASHPAAHELDQVVSHFQNVYPKATLFYGTLRIPPRA